LGHKNSYAQDTKKVQVILKQSYVSRYIWRGQDIYADDQGAYQPSLTLDYKNILDSGDLSFNLWGSFATSSGYEQGDELDYSFSYKPNLDLPYEVTLGSTYYDFPQLNRRSDALETWINLAADDLTSLDLTLNLFAGYNFKVASGGPNPGWYYAWGVSKDFKLNSLLAKDEEQNISLTLTNWGTDGVADLSPSLVYATQVSLDTRYEFSDFAITPSLNYVVNYESGVNQGKEEFWLGLTVAYSY
jgi:hypothetical protein